MSSSDRAPDLAVLEEIQRRVLWLAVRIVDAANRERDTGDGVKVGGHQASSASLVSVMTALWFAHLDAPDRVAVKPHASPVFHAIRYLLGNLDRSYLTRLRARGGLQSYPSHTKDPDEVDFSTGSVGLGAAAPLFAAVTRRYVDSHFGSRPRSRFYALLGDAELDEGNVWEAVADPATQGLGNVTWLVDFNRKSLDRVVPGVRIAQWSQQFGAAGWHVVEVKYGRRLRAAFDRPGGPALPDWIDAMGNEQYQSLFGLAGDDLRKQFCDGAPDEVQTFVAGVPDADLAHLVTDLGGHDLASLLEAFAACDRVTDRPSVVFAYYGVYSGARFVVAGTPSGVRLAPEGGAHQSSITPSVGLELPGVTFVEPAYAVALDWLLCDALGRIAAGPSATRTAPVVHVASSGAVLPEALGAAAELADEGIAAHVVDVTSLDRLYTAWQRTLRQGVRTATAPSVPGALRTVLGDRHPVVTVHDGASHAMAWLGSALGVPAVPIGVDAFGQSGSVRELYELHDLLPGSIVNAALAALSLR